MIGLPQDLHQSLLQPHSSDMISFQPGSPITQFGTDKTPKLSGILDSAARSFFRSGQSAGTRSRPAASAAATGACGCDDMGEASGLPAGDAAGNTVGRFGSLLCTLQMLLIFRMSLCSGAVWRGSDLSKLKPGTVTKGGHIMNTVFAATSRSLHFTAEANKTLWRNLGCDEIRQVLDWETAVFLAVFFVLKVAYEEHQKELQVRACMQAAVAVPATGSSVASACGLGGHSTARAAEGADVPSLWLQGTDVLADFASASHSLFGFVVTLQVLRHILSTLLVVFEGQLNAIYDKLTERLGGQAGAFGSHRSGKSKEPRNSLAPTASALLTLQYGKGERACMEP